MMHRNAGEHEMNTITEQLDTAYAAGKFAVICTTYVLMPVRDRSMIRASKDGKGVYVKNGKKEIYAFAYQIKFVKNA
jgi:hypothetical protein